ncbi:hypothetical protein BDZ88DRAFT_415135 [Geranomyces variabilis]|nr:hypothetical protein BDZ88DRAFT_415135 [Geranomyces variabilis]
MSPPGFVEMVSLSDLEVEGGGLSTSPPPLPTAPLPTETPERETSPLNPPKPALLAHPRNSFRNNHNPALHSAIMSEQPHRASHDQFATAAESATAPAATVFAPPAYTPSGPPPRYIPPRRSRHEYEAARRAALVASFGFESSEESDIRPAGIRWWMIAIIGSDLVTSTLLLFLTLASLSQSSPGPINPAAIVLPFVYVFLSAWGKSGVSRDLSAGKLVYTATYLMRWVADIAGTVIAIRASSGTDTTDGGESEGNGGDSGHAASPMAWVLEAVRIFVVGMRPAQTQCVLSDAACTWRLAAWGGMLVFDAALAFVLIVRMCAEHRHVQGRPPLDSARPDMISSDSELASGRRPPPSRHAMVAADDGFRTSVLTVSSGSSSSDGSTLNEHPGVTHHISISIPHGSGPGDVARVPHEKEDDSFDDVPLGVFMQGREIEEEDADDSAPLALILARLQYRNPAPE